ncbi:phage tail tape measure protein [Streptomyces sp. NPDC059568]|uniref:phage tail tape measure protein n=1 Tax=Streptomyces sp. NPDC059568 TaxID=3346868 RepID=UPI0036CE0C2F
MALTIGELVGYVRIDDSEVRPTLRRTEVAYQRSGQQIAGEADRAGQRAGQALGEGLTRAADGSIRDARGRFVAAARRSGDAAGDALGTALADGAAAGAADAVDAAEGGLSRMQTMAAAVGVAAGAALMAGIAQYLEQSQILGVLEARIGGAPAVAQKYGRAAGKLFASAVVADFQTAADTMAAIAQNGLLPTAATEAQIQNLGTRVANTATVLGEEVASVSTTVGKMVKTGMARDANEAMDILVRAQQKGLNASEDLLDTFDEYSTQFRKVGIDGPMAMGLVSQALAGGARDTDIAADAVKEFSLLSIDGSEAAADAYKALGLDADKMIATLAAGGPKATAAMDTIFDRIRGLDDPVKKNTVAIGLFGTKFEDLGGAFDTMDPSKAAAKFGAFKGSIDAAGKSISETDGVRVERFKRGLQQGIVNVLGSQVIPALAQFGAWAQQNSGTLRILAGVVGGVLVPVLVLMGVSATVAGARVVAGWVMSGAAATRSAATQVVASGRAVGGWIAQGGAAVAQGARVAGVWVMTGVRAGAGAAVQVAAGARVVGGWVLMGVQSMIQGARMAAAWVIAMGPIGWVIAAIVGLGLLIWANWDKIKKWTSQAWDWVWDKIKSVGVSIVTTVVGFVARALAAWDRLKTSAINKAVQLVTWVRGLPGRIGSAIGDLGSLLLDKGKNVVQGLWNGIKSMGGWIEGKILGWAKSTIPGPIAKALGIASPSKVTAAQGRWIARGLVEGLTGSSKQVKAAAEKLADIVTNALKPGKKRSAALGKISAGSKQLLKLASQEEKLADRLKKASTKLSELIKERDKLAGDVKSGILNAANITGQSGSNSPEAILARLQRDRKAAEQFAKSLAALKKQGVRADLISQIAQAGVEQGAGVAASLASATPTQIKAINAEQAQLALAAGKAGNAAADAMYSSGVRAAQGLVQGLQKEQKGIEAQMLKIAKAMSKSIRTALGIKSPSRVMARVGAFTAQGLVKGIEGGRRAVDRTMASLVSTPPTGQWAMSAAANTPQGTSGRVVNNTTNTTYHLTQREMTLRDLEVLQRRQDARARVGRPR